MSEGQHSTKSDVGAMILAANEVFVCRASGEGSHDFRVCTDEAAVLEFYDEMFGKEQDGTLDLTIKHLRDEDNWSNACTAYYCELYCAAFEVWKVDREQVAAPAIRSGDQQSPCGCTYGCAAAGGQLPAGRYCEHPPLGGSALIDDGAKMVARLITGYSGRKDPIYADVGALLARMVDALKSVAPSAALNQADYFEGEGLPHIASTARMGTIEGDAALLREFRASRTDSSTAKPIAHPDKVPTVFLCCADGEGSHEFKVCADRAAVAKFYESMFGRDLDGTLESLDTSFDDSDNWRNDGTAFEIELYCARFYVWKVTPDEIAYVASSTALDDRDWLNGLRQGAALCDAKAEHFKSKGPLFQADVMAARECAEAIRNHIKAYPGSPVASATAKGALKLDTDSQVFFYEQDHYYLSNFSAFNVEWMGAIHETSEHAYHWSRFPEESNHRLAIRATRSAHEAFRYAQEHKADQRPEWDTIKVLVMRNILRAKAEQHEYVRRKLLQTGDRELIENSWRDPFWGWGENRDGLNMLGKVWMEVRAELRAAQPEEAKGS